MMRIPPEIDRIMWAIAEDRNANAADEFLRRYPIYREELMRRQQAVSGLRTGRPAGSVAKREIPRFVPREGVRPNPDGRKVAIVASLVLAALAAASYTLTSTLLPPPRPRPIEPVRHVHTEPPAMNVEPVMVTPPPTQAPPVVASGPKETPSYLKPRNLAIKSAPLQDVLRLLGAQSGLRIVLAPRMANPTISVEYQDLTALEILQDMGARYRFTAFDQGDGSVVIYPATDPLGSLPATDGSGGSRRIGN